MTSRDLAKMLRACNSPDAEIKVMVHDSEFGGERLLDLSAITKNNDGPIILHERQVT